MSKNGIQNTEKIVKTYSGSRLDEIPRFLVLEGKEYTIKEIFPVGLLSENGENRREFMVRLENGRTFRLIQWEDRWSVLEYRPGQKID